MFEVIVMGFLACILGFTIRIHHLVYEGGRKKKKVDAYRISGKQKRFIAKSKMGGG